ncbi:hypothetical protein ACFPOD_08640 [Nitratireductor kimnyeongensis]|uniref:Uncharacterized protein n=1 Tax=Nitratireductor kimnyeongensis TaxID=430679 RepID=A0ABW0T7I8_9HYPH|nr:hypothetical protein [Nitratireductor kimnyeongensis]
MIDAGNLEIAPNTRNEHRRTKNKESRMAGLVVKKNSYQTIASRTNGEHADVLKQRADVPNVDVFRYAIPAVFHRMSPIDREGMPQQH